MSPLKPDQIAAAETADPNLKNLYKVGGAAALIAVIFFRRNLGAELSLFISGGAIDIGRTTIPSNAADWFVLLQDHRLVGLTLLSLFDIVNYALLGLVFLALYGALRRAAASAMALATTFGLVGLAVYFASNQTFAMLSLSGKYAAATTEAQRSMLLAAGEALLAIDNPGSIYQGTGIYISLLFVTLAGLMMALVMLRSNIFGKTTAYVGILAQIFQLGYFVVLAFAPALSYLPPTLSAPFRVIWYILIARRLFQLGAGNVQSPTLNKSG